MKKREPQTKEEFIAELCLKYEMDEETLLSVIKVIPCKDCIYAGCTGWITTSKEEIIGGGLYYRFTTL